MLNIKVIGYYGHYNAGDEQYKTTFKQLLDTYLTTYLFNLEFIDCDVIASHTFDSNDIIIVGGGDVLNDYFLDKIIAKFNGCNNKIIAVSVGLPFESTLTCTNKLNIIDYIFIRCKGDLDVFGMYFHAHRVYYLPDISFLLTHQNKDNDDSQNMYIKRLNTLKEMNKKIVCISLTRHIYGNDTYKTIVSSMCTLIKQLVIKKYHVLMLPFNGNVNNDKENDILIHQDVLNDLLSCTRLTLSDITFVSEWQDSSTVFSIFRNYVDFSISMRYHGCLFSFHNNIPCFPIFTTRKVRNLLIDYDWQYGYQLDVDNNELPINFKEDILNTRFSTFLDSVQQRPNLVNKLRNINAFNLQNEIIDSCKVLMNAITTPYSKLNMKGLVNKQSKVIDEIYKSVQVFANTKGYHDFRSIKDENIQNIVVSIVSYKLTNGDIHSKYCHGLKAKMFNIYYNYEEEWKWILEEERKFKNCHSLVSNPFGMVNLGYINQNDTSGVHRSGWQYVYDNIKQLHNNSCELYLDLYIDKTFHWDRDINTLLGIIPYKQSWVGFIHHTFDTSFSTYNCYTLFECPEFLESLKYCKALFVLSKYLQIKLENVLRDKGFEIRVHALVHPTEIQVPKFSMDLFLQNNRKLLIQVGGWLRNTYSFYKLSLPKRSKIHMGFLLGDKSKRALASFDCTLNKTVLKGKYMNNYYPLPNFLDTLHNSLITQHELSDCIPYVSQNISQNISQCISRDNSHIESKITNNWYKHMYSDIATALKTVNVIQHLANSEYDILLSQNIVFVNLVDASAVNTVIECIVRTTPIIVNRHPAVVEVLGIDYPLYFSNEPDNYNKLNKEINALLRDTSNIKRAYYYLQELDIQKFSIHTFKNRLIECLKEL